MRNSTIAAAIGIFVAGSAMAQTGFNRGQEEEAINAITTVGGTCEQVVRNQAIGQLDDNTTLMAVACNGGDAEQYVLQIDQRGNMAFYATCENLAKGTNNEIRCFTQTGGRQRDSFQR